MKIFITGIAGFIGTNLAEHLHNQGHEVFGVDSMVCETWRNLSYLQEKKIEVDVITVSSIHRIPIADVIINLACPASPVMYSSYPTSTVQSNSTDIIKVCDWARIKNAYLIHASSSEVYGNQFLQVENQPLTTDPSTPRGIYAEGKRLSEAIIHQFYPERSAILRIFNTYGPWMGSKDGRIIPNFFSAWKYGQPYIVDKPGHQTRSYLYISDFIDAIDKLIQEKPIGIFNIGSDEEYSALQMAELFVNKFGGKIAWSEEREKEIMKRKPNYMKLSSKVGWFPKVSLDEGLDRTMEWLTSNQ